MIREVHLISYLPQFMQEFQEIKAALDAEDPEFILVWTASDQVLKNEFITTADEYGISHFESLLGILPYAEDTLESRRARVLAEWFDSLPYTIRMLIQKLKMICGEDGFTLSYDFTTGYTLSITTNLELFGAVEELERTLNSMVPCNIVFDCQNQIPCVPEDTTWYVGGAVTFTEEINITGDFRESYDIKADADMKGGIVNTAMLKFTNDFNETMETDGNAKQASGAVFVDFVEIKSEE